MLSNDASPPVMATQLLHVKQHTFEGTIWSFAAISFLFLAFRLYSRFSGPRRLYWDDGFVILAWLLLLLSAILWTYIASYLYAFYDVINGYSQPGPAFVLHSEQYYTGQLIVLVFFYSGLWSVKFSFLFFFRRLGENVSRIRYLLWVAFFFTTATYLVCIGTIQYRCLARPLAEIQAHCSSEANIDFTLVTLKVNTALDIITDSLISIIPISLVWNVQIPTRRKMALIGIFSLVLVTIAFAIVRVVVVSELTHQPDVSWLYLWSAIEQGVAIIVACLSAFPHLFARTTHRAANPRFIPQKDSDGGIRVRRPYWDFSTIGMSTFNQTGGDLTYLNEQEEGHPRYSATSSMRELGVPQHDHGR
ncbi:hypothetical protein F5B22DRAFT_611247 [Xylaria bambusicola]|uniref:uncharacterized protein n=1 Tax=Xylaria bambusicola TaxID=326684 RepID=UPI0020081172|nr:uncharacterized protein F5B22DRAFT_611247 [Xylaria bambusicola]KAI0514353.1 hypothetical protein F5B22DRAFT_611247 [Xylaria bambusicola]